MEVVDLPNAADVRIQFSKRIIADDGREFLAGTAPIEDGSQTVIVFDPITGMVKSIPDRDIMTWIADAKRLAADMAEFL